MNTARKTTNNSGNSPFVDKIDSSMNRKKKKEFRNRKKQSTPDSRLCFKTRSFIRGLQEENHDSDDDLEYFEEFYS